MLNSGKDLKMCTIPVQYNSPRHGYAQEEPKTEGTRIEIRTSNVSTLSFQVYKTSLCVSFSPSARSPVLSTVSKEQEVYFPHLIANCSHLK